MRFVVSFVLFQHFLVILPFILILILAIGYLGLQLVV